jgi:hypothetical protein
LVRNPETTAQLVKIPIRLKILSFAQRPSEPQLIDALRKATNNPGYHAEYALHSHPVAAFQKIFVRQERQDVPAPR